MAEVPEHIAFARQLIAENKETQATTLNLSYCGLTDLEQDVPELFELFWLKELILGNSNWDNKQKVRIWGKNSKWNNDTLRHPQSIKALAKLENLTKLDLSNSKISDEGELYLSELKNLTHLHLNNVIFQTNQTKGIAHLKKLTHLYLGGTYINSQGLKAITQLENLTHIYLNGNEMSDDCVEVLAQVKTLTLLNLSGNYIYGGAKGLAQLKNLTHLDLCSNRINAEGANAIAQLTKLKDLNLWQNYIGDEGSKALAQLENLKTLNLRENGIGKEGAKAIAQMKNLNSLNLWENNISNEGTIAISQLKSLTHLDLCSNSISDDGLQAIGKLENLIELNLEGNQIGSEGAKAIAQLKNLTKLNLCGNQIGEEGLKAISQLENLIQLNLNSNEIGDEGAKAIAPLKKLRHLDLTNNQIGAKGAKAIALLVNLERLNLNSNEIDDEAVEAISILKKLTQLNLGGNKIGNEGAKAIAQLRNLTQLSLNNNDLGDEGVKAIGQLENLTQLYLNENKIGDEGAKAIAQLSNLKKLNISGNNLKSLKPLLPLIKKDGLFGFKYDSYGKQYYSTIEDPITEPPIEIVRQGRLAILEYFDKRDEEEKVELDAYINTEVKMVLVGNSDSGKSSLVHYLLNKEINFNLRSTHWMEIKDWNRPFGEESPISNIRIFDFGGQEYYHDTHHLFFTQNTAYVLLWDKESNGLFTKTVRQKQHLDGLIKSIELQCFPLEYWLDAIKYFTCYSEEKESIDPEKKDSDNSHQENPARTLSHRKNTHQKQELPPVLLVQNKLDEGRPEKLPLNVLAKHYHDIYDSTAISVLKDRLLPNLEALIKEMLREMKILRDEYLGIHGIIREELMRYNGEAVLSLDNFKNKCNKWISDAGERANKNYSTLHIDTVGAKNMAEIFSWLGYVLFYPESDALKNNVYVNQNVITKGIHSILSELQNKGGEFDEKYANEKLKGESEENKHTETEPLPIDNLIALMTHFNLIFEHPDQAAKPNTYIAPLYLPEKPPKGISLFMDVFKNPIFRIQYKGFIHKGVILHFFQEYGKHALTETSLNHEDFFYFWRYGIVVKKHLEEMVLVRFYPGNDWKNGEETIREHAHIDLYALDDKSTDGVLVKEILKKLREINKGWAVDEMVTADGENFVKLDEILKNERSKQYIFQYQDKQYELSQFKQYLTSRLPMKKVFISYSKTDEHYRNELEKHLSVMKRNGTIASWHDRKLLPGEKWDGKIKQELKEADIILFLVSSDFLATDYIYDVELDLALKRDKDSNDNVICVPIILRPCDWEDSPLGQFNSPEKGIVISTSVDTDEALLKIVKKLKEIL